MVAIDDQDLDENYMITPMMLIRGNSRHNDMSLINYLLLMILIEES